MDIFEKRLEMSFDTKDTKIVNDLKKEFNKTKQEMLGIPHHLLDVAIPKKKFTVVEYKKLVEEKIEEILENYGEEKFSKKIAKNIVEQRKQGRIKTTFQLIEIIKDATPSAYWRGKIHYATRTFQALRIAVNDELENVKRILPDAVSALEPEGRLVVISFHSLEDRIVKNFFRDKTKEGKAKLINKKPIIAKKEEIKNNPRSRSAKLRVLEKNNQ